jgi:hypothetical protein
MPGEIVPMQPADDSTELPNNDHMPRLVNHCTCDFAPQNVLTSAGVASSLCALKLESACEIGLTLSSRLFDCRRDFFSRPPGEVATPPPEIN